MTIETYLSANWMPLSIGFIIGIFFLLSMVKILSLLKRKKKIDLFGQKEIIESTHNHLKLANEEINKIYNFFNRLEKQLETK